MMIYDNTQDLSLGGSVKTVSGAFSPAGAGTLQAQPDLSTSNSIAALTPTVQILEPPTSAPVITMKPPEQLGGTAQMTEESGPINTDIPGTSVDPGIIAASELPNVGGSKTWIWLLVIAVIVAIVYVASRKRK